MKTPRCFAILALAAALFLPVFAARPAVPPKFEETFGIIHEHITGFGGDELDQAAVRGLLKELYPRVLLVTNDAAAASVRTPLLTRTNLHDLFFACIRIGRVEAGLPEELSAAVRDLLSTNRIKGIMLDLRFAKGGDYAAAAAAADLFLDADEPLLDWGTASVRSTCKTNAIRIPMVVIVNRGTAEAAEALAAALRESKAGLLAGGTTAGRAHVYKEFPLKDGGRLRVAAAAVKAGAGNPLPETGLKPDIEVNVPARDEKIYFENPFAAVAAVSSAKTNAAPGFSASSASTNQPRNRMNEAELVRRHRAGLSLEDDGPETTKPEGRTEEPRLLRDPVMVRSLDMLKGIAILRPDR